MRRTCTLPDTLWLACGELPPTTHPRAHAALSRRRASTQPCTALLTPARSLHTQGRLARQRAQALCLPARRPSLRLLRPAASSAAPGRGLLPVRRGQDVRPLPPPHPPQRVPRPIRRAGGASSLHEGVPRRRAGDAVRGRRRLRHRQRRDQLRQVPRGVRDAGLHRSAASSSPSDAGPSSHGACTCRRTAYPRLLHCQCRRAPVFGRGYARAAPRRTLGRVRRQPSVRRGGVVRPLPPRRGTGMRAPRTRSINKTQRDETPRNDA